MRPQRNLEEVPMSPKVALALMALVVGLFGVLAVRVVRRVIRERVARLSPSSE